MNITQPNVYTKKINQNRLNVGKPWCSYTEIKRKAKLPFLNIISQYSEVLVKTIKQGNWIIEIWIGREVMKGPVFADGMFLHFKIDTQDHNKSDLRNNFSKLVKHNLNMQQS